MNNMHIRLFTILMLVLGFTVSHTVLAQKISVSAANPASAVQGTFNLDVEISGNGFDETIEEVKFLLPCLEEPCTDTGGITVDQENISVLGRKKIKVNIDVSESAAIADFDIRVKTSRGRGGKGTTLFKVQSSTKPKGGFSTHDISAEFVGLAWEEAFPHNGVNLPSGWENWTANTLESIPRPCLLGVHLVDPPSAGRYDCQYETAHGGMISIDLAEISRLAATAQQPIAAIWEVLPLGKKPAPNPEYCELLNRWAEFSPCAPLAFGSTRYKLNFMEGCTDIDCHIGIHQQSYNGVAPRQGFVQLHPFHDLTKERLPIGMESLPDVAQLIVKSWSTSEPTSEDFNPFIKERTLGIEGFEIHFGSAKKNALLAKCRTIPGTVNGVWMETIPDLVGVGN